MEPAEVIEELLTANLRGRGGAFFPMGRKASFLAQGDPLPRRQRRRVGAGHLQGPRDHARDPHRLIEGCLITAHAIGCDERLHLHPRRVPARVRGDPRRARRGARSAGCSAACTIVVAPRRRRVHLRRGVGAARVARGQARPAARRGRRSPPSPGLYQAPTLINNVETIATVPVVIELGGEEYAKLGVPPNSTGTRVFSLSGNVVNGGNYELELGTTLRELIYDIGGGIPDGRELKASSRAARRRRCCAPTRSTCRSTRTRPPSSGRCSAPAR